MSDAYVITGGKPLSGTVQLSGAKNVALKVIIASLLFDSPVKLTNIPQIADVKELIDLINTLGPKIERNRGEVDIVPAKITKNTFDLVEAVKMRVSFMLFAPLLIRSGSAIIPNPGGCRLGTRPIDRQVEMMRAFGATVNYDSSTGYYHASLPDKKPNAVRFRFSKKTHTGTELAIMFGIFAKGKSVLSNCAMEPEIDDLIAFLNKSGASIKRSGEEIIIDGVDKLQLTTAYAISCDRNEAPTYAVFALATKGDVTIKGIRPDDMRHFINQVKDSGGGVEESEESIRFFYTGNLKSSNITTLPHPGFMTDWQGPWAVLMTQAQGESIIHETVFENRFGHVSELKKLGAKIEYFEPQVENPEEVYQFNYHEREENCSPQAIKIFGPTPLHNGILTVSDLRAGASLLIAAAIAQGETIIHGASVIDRGYEHIDKKLQRLGATIKKEYYA